MADPIGLRDTEGALRSAGHNLYVAAENATVHVAGGTATSVMKSLGSHGGALVVGTAITAGLTQWDYLEERDTIRKRYEMELSARTGKPYNDLSNKDLDAVGKNNVVMKDALRRARWKRNLGFVVGALAVGAAFLTGAAALSFVIAPALAFITGGAAIPATLAAAQGAGAVGLFLAQALPVGVASVMGFMATESVAGKIGEKQFGLEEPSIRHATKHPELQDKLSLSSQVTYLQHLQKRVHSHKPETFISQEQVLKVFLAANPAMAKDIEGRYGRKFSSLAPQLRAQVIEEVNQSVNIKQITSDINSHQIRAQELAFLVQGETSGVPRHDAPRVRALENEHKGIRQELAQARTEIAHLRQQMRAKSTQLGGIEQDGRRMDFSVQSADNAPELTMGPAQQREIARRLAAQKQSTVRA